MELRRNHCDVSMLPLNMEGKPSDLEAPILLNMVGFKTMVACGLTWFIMNLVK